jgi:hypothetical protein
MLVLAQIVSKKFHTFCMNRRRQLEGMHILHRLSARDRYFDARNTRLHPREPND